jgi:hypothetical protein
MWFKHIISISDLIDDLDHTIPPYELWDEKITDAINYLILLDALIHERIKTVTAYKNKASQNYCKYCPVL